MMRPEVIRMHIPQIYEVTCEFVDKMQALRDPKTLELPSNFMNELNKWTLECKYIHGVRHHFTSRVQVEDVKLNRKIFYYFAIDSS